MESGMEYAMETLGSPRRMSILPSGEVMSAHMRNSYEPGTWTIPPPAFQPLGTSMENECSRFSCMETQAAVWENRGAAKANIRMEWKRGIGNPPPYTAQLGKEGPHWARFLAWAWPRFPEATGLAICLQRARKLK